MKKQITIYDLLPFMDGEGYVFYQHFSDGDCGWLWSDKKPKLTETHFEMIFGETNIRFLNTPFNIKPADDWRKSLIRVSDYQRKHPNHFSQTEKKVEMLDAQKMLNVLEDTRDFVIAYGFLSGDSVRKHFEEWKKRKANASKKDE